MRGAYARDVDPSEHQPGVKPGARRRTPLRVSGEVETAEVSVVGAVTQEFEPPDIVSADPPTAATPASSSPKSSHSSLRSKL